MTNAMKKWRIHTSHQLGELCNECFWVWTTSYKGQNVNGYIVYKAKRKTDKGIKVTSGNASSSFYDVSQDAHIFLPSAGYRCFNDKIHNVGFGFYWSRSLSKLTDKAHYLLFNADHVGLTSDNRSNGLLVRAVCHATK